ncbi:MAG: hypothetical protein K8S99_11865 [Planctomycetes bacterium]|nr:hypothetical protein [Planctomycetota bacterium]
MSAPDFYFANNSMFRHIHDRYGKAALVTYWRELGSDYYRQRTDAWRSGGAAAIADDWRAYFAKEPQAQVEASVEEGGAVKLDIKQCPAIKHLRDSGREIVPYFCEHCDHICGSMAQGVGMRFERSGGMGSCVQRFVPLTTKGRA